MRPLERPQLEVIKDCEEEFLRVAWGKGSVVLVDSEYCDATDAAGVVLWENACTAKSRGKRKVGRAIECLDQDSAVGRLHKYKSRPMVV